MDNGSILLVEPDDAAADATQRILEEAGYAVVAMPDVESAASVLEYARPDVVMVAYPVGNRATDNLAAIVRASSRPHVPVVALYPYSKRSLAAQALADGCADVLPKPIDRLLLTNLLATLRRHVVSAPLSPEQSQTRS